MKKRTSNWSVAVTVFMLSVSLLGCQSKEGEESKDSALNAVGGEEWSETLRNEGEIRADIDGDGQDDRVKIDYVTLEGSQYIEKFEVSLAGRERSFLIDQTYDASFVKMELFDIDGDQKDELLLLFDTHGGGGEGTHDLYLLWLNADEIAAEKADPFVKGIEDLDASWSVDGIFDIEKEGEKLLAYQYVWGDGGHSDVVGNLVSTVTYHKEDHSFYAEEYSLEEEGELD